MVVTTTVMDAGAKKWLQRTAAKNMWRCPRWYAVDDLIADGLMIWCRVVKKYEQDAGENLSRAHLMALFKTSFNNHLIWLSSKATKDRPTVSIHDIAPAIKEDECFDDWASIDMPSDMSDVAMMVAEAPALLKPLLNKLTTAISLPQLNKPYSVNRNGTRETLNDRLCNLVGLSPNIDLTTPLKNFLLNR